MTEIWRDIVGYEGLYQVSNLGQVKSLDRFIGHRYSGKLRKISGRIIKPCKLNGYNVVFLVKDTKRKTHQLHRLVAEAFLANPDNLTIVHHKDENRLNNNVNNLSWCTQKENVNFSVEKMKKPKSVTQSNTNEKYIHFRARNNNYELTINKKYYGKFNSLEEAIKRRDEVLSVG